MESNFKELVDKYSDITEAYEIVKTVEVVKDEKQRYRIDVIKSQKNTEYYDIQIFICDHAGGFTSPRIPYGMPWVKESTPELALRCAINFILTGNVH